MQKFCQIIFAFAVILSCLGCNSNSKIAAADNETKFPGEKSKLLVELFEKLDYQVKNFSEGAADEWHKQQFQTLWKRVYKIKRTTPLKEESQTFPRFTVVEEVYETEDLAVRRLERIQDKPPNLLVEQQEYWIVTGFQNKKNVYFIQTDSVLIGYFMQDFAEKIANEIK